MSNHIYQDTFFNYVNTTSGRSAQHFLEKVKFPFPITSLLDVGCGQGAWLNRWKQKYPDLTILGIDGDYVKKESLLIEADKFQAIDLKNGFNLNQTFSMVECLEVAEHIDEAYSDILIKSITQHSQMILFSAAQKGQGGEFHVNEQPINYWVKKFAQYGYICLDCVRPQVKDDKNIEPWYRFNSVLFIHQDLAEQLPAEFQAYRVTQDYDFTKDMDKAWLMRNAVIGLLPTHFVTQLSKLKQKILPFVRQS